MKTVYFVRHGESINNAADRYNAPDTPLSEKGRQQIIQIAERCEKLPVEIIVSSTMERAKDTAAAINERVSKRIELSELFCERKLPSSIIGALRNTSETIHIVREITENFSDPSYRYEDGENFEDLKNRALRALTYLEKHSENNIIVVTHGFFMWVIVAAAVFGQKLSGEECKSIIHGFGNMENTSLSILKYGEYVHKSTGTAELLWRVAVWNDHAHLG